jgi:hypothetical protein
VTFEEYQRGQMAASGAVHAEHERWEPPTTMSLEMKVFNNRLAGVRQEQTARAVAAPATPAALQRGEAQTADEGTGQVRRCEFLRNLLSSQIAYTLNED